MRTPENVHRGAGAEADRLAVGVGPGRSGLAILMCLLFAGVMGLYAPVLDHRFLNFDDPVYVTENEVVARGVRAEGIEWAFTTLHSANWHPLTWLSHMLDTSLFGMNAGPRLLENALLHAIASAFLLRALYRLTGALGPSAFAAALFALHPVRVESVAWLAERKDVLAALFFVLALDAYADAGRGRRAMSRVVLWMALGLLAKPVLVPLPLILLLVDAWPLGRPIWRGGSARLWALVSEKKALFALAAISAVVTIVAQHRGGALANMADIPIWPRVANAALAYVRYLGIVVWPASLAPLHPYDRTLLDVRAAWPRVASAALVLLAISGTTLRLASTRPWLAVGWFWYLIMLAPVIGLVQVGSQALAERYLGLPLIGLVLAAAVEVSDRAAGLRTGWLRAVALAILLACAIRTAQQLQLWRDDLALFTHAVRSEPTSEIAQLHLGLALEASGRNREAQTHYAEAVRIDPRFAAAHNNLANLLAEQGRSDEAIAHYETALRIQPGFPPARAGLAQTENNLAITFARAGRLREAEAHLEAALDANPDLTEARFNLAEVLAQSGEREKAIAQLEDLLRRRPGYADALNRLAELRRVPGPGPSL
jgi:protein O-mannosyl-transferase